MSTTIHNLLFDSLCFGGYVPQTDSLVTNKNGNSEFRNETDSVKCLRYRRCSNSRFPVQFCEIRFLKSCLDETYSWDLHLTSSKYFNSRLWHRWFTESSGLPEQGRSCSDYLSSSRWVDAWDGFWYFLMVTCARELKAPFAPSLSHILCVIPVLFRLLLSLVESSSIIEWAR